jgi:hypothetical protein
MKAHLRFAFLQITEPEFPYYTVEKAAAKVADQGVRLPPLTPAPAAVSSSALEPPVVCAMPPDVNRTPPCSPVAGQDADKLQMLATLLGSGYVDDARKEIQADVLQFLPEEMGRLVEIAKHQ